MGASGTGHGNGSFWDQPPALCLDGSGNPGRSGLWCIRYLYCSEISDTTGSISDAMYQ